MNNVTTVKNWGQDAPENGELREDVAALLTGESQEDFFAVFRQTARGFIQQFLLRALKEEASIFIDVHQDLVDENGHRKVVRNGYTEPRQVTTCYGTFEVEAPRIHSSEEGIRFVSKILPPYLRRDPQLEEVVALLYLKGVSTNKMAEVMQEFYGDKVQGFSASNVTRLLKSIEEEYRHWSQRRLDHKRYVYWWADGIHFTVRSDGEKLCVLTVIGVTPDGHKEVLALAPGQRESTLTWKEILLDLKNRGLTHPPKLAVADGALGFWSALREVWPDVKEQPCWVHKTRNVLDKLPRSWQEDAKNQLYKIMNAPNKAEAMQQYKTFVALYDDKYPRAVECLRKDINRLLTFYDFPAAHWRSIRSTNAIESTFATVRRRTNSTGGRCTKDATVAMVYKLAMAAQHNWRRLNKYPFLQKVQAGFVFVNGELEQSQMTEERKVA